MFTGSRLGVSSFFNSFSRKTFRFECLFQFYSSSALISLLPWRFGPEGGKRCSEPQLKGLSKFRSVSKADIFSSAALGFPDLYDCLMGHRIL